MSTHAIHRVHLNPRDLAVAAAAAGVAVTVGYAIAAATLPEPHAPAPQTIVIEAPSAQPGSDAYDGTDREVRQLMHLRK